MDIRTFKYYTHSFYCMAGDQNIGGDISMGTDAWNVADGYTQLKILRQLIMLDRWDTISQFGTEELDEDRTFDDNGIKKRRVEALQRFHSTTRQLLGNVLFALKKADQKTVTTMVERINNTEEYLSKSFKITQDQVSHEDLFEINEELFKNILDILQAVKDELNTPLNNAGLIFRPTEEVDLDKIMNDIVQGG